MNVAGSTLQGGEDLFVRRVPPGRRFGVHEPTVGDDFKPSAERLDQLHGSCRIPFLECGRQTGGSGTVVSDDAELDGYVHADMFGPHPDAIKAGPVSGQVGT